MAADGIQHAGGFDDLFGSTVARSIEGAAVREPVSARRSAPEPERQPVRVLVFSTGDRVIVDRPCVLGRNPRPPVESGETPPRLVTIAGHRVSRQHAAVTIDRWQTIIEDLDSANGTEVTIPGEPTRRLQARQPLSLVVGTRVVLANDVSFVLEEVA